MLVAAPLGVTEATSMVPPVAPVALTTVVVALSIPAVNPVPMAPKSKSRPVPPAGTTLSTTNF